MNTVLTEEELELQKIYKEEKTPIMITGKVLKTKKWMKLKK